MNDEVAPDPSPARPGQRAELFISERIMPKYKGWDGVSWGSWTPKEISDMVRAMAEDYLDDYGSGHDWQEAGHQAQFVLCGIYNDIYNFRSGGRVQGRESEMRAQITWPGREESFEVLLVRPTEHLIPPLPLPNGGFANRPLGSVVNQATVRAAATFDCLKLPDEGILSLLDLLSAHIGNKDRLSLMMAAAILTRWKGCQVSQVVQGGAVYRQIKNPEYPQMPEADVRILYARTGVHLDRSFALHGPQSNIVVLT